MGTPLPSPLKSNWSCYHLLGHEVYLQRPRTTTSFIISSAIGTQKNWNFRCVPYKQYSIVYFRNCLFSGREEFLSMLILSPNSIIPSSENSSYVNAISNSINITWLTHYEHGHASWNFLAFEVWWALLPMYWGPPFYKQFSYALLLSNPMPRMPWN